jgi:hypothetical protein
LHTFGVTVAPHGHGVGGFAVDDQPRVGVDAAEVGVVFRNELYPALKIVLGVLSCPLGCADGGSV